MAKVIINNEEIELPEGERLNGIQAARLAGVEIPHYCWHPGLSVVASCRMCLVESGRKDPESGDVSMVPKLVPACQTPATDGTVFVTDSDKVKQARAMVEEDLLIRHPIDCPICDKAGECSLQDYHFEHGQGARRADLKPFTSRRRPMGDTVTLFVDRCVMCTRCVRFTREITGTSELMVVNRGAHEEIDVFPGFPLDNKLAGNVVDLCPVGALGDKDFLYSQRVWFMQSQEHVCAGCATGCSINVDANQDRVYRLKPRENPHVNGWWMCDEGRYGFKYLHADERVTIAEKQNADGDYHHLEWQDFIKDIESTLRQAGHLALVLSPFVTVEEAYLLGKFIRGIDPKAVLVLGPVPEEEADETFPNGFTIRAEKCPNRRGVEAVISGLQQELISWDELQSEGLGAIWFAGGYKSPWHDEAVAAKFEAVPVRIVQDLFRSPLWETAQYRLPGVGFAERAGSFVNATDRLQSFDWAIRPPAGAMSEGQLVWQLMARSGLYQPRTVLREVASEFAYFHVALEEIPAVGVDLKINQMVGA